MTQRAAVFVGCRLIAIYVVVDVVGSIATALSYALQMAGNGGAGRGVMPASVLQPIILQAAIRAGMAVLVWAAAARISQIAADREDGDDGEHLD